MAFLKGQTSVIIETITVIVFSNTIDFSEVWSDSLIAPAASLNVWQWYEAFEGYVHKMLLKVNYFASDKGENLHCRIFTEAEM